VKGFDGWPHYEPCLHGVVPHIQTRSRPGIMDGNRPVMGRRRRQPDLLLLVEASASHSTDRTMTSTRLEVVVFVQSRIRRRWTGQGRENQRTWLPHIPHILVLQLEIATPFPSMHLLHRCP
jgi:hypothetical protein